MTMTTPALRDEVLAASSDASVPQHVSLVDRTLMHVGLALLLLGQRRATAPRAAERPRVVLGDRPGAEIGRQFC